MIYLCAFFTVHQVFHLQLIKLMKLKSVSGTQRVCAILNIKGLSLCCFFQLPWKHLIHAGGSLKEAAIENVGRVLFGRWLFCFASLASSIKQTKRWFTHHLGWGSRGTCVKFKAGSFLLHFFLVLHIFNLFLCSIFNSFYEKNSVFIELFWNLKVTQKNVSVSVWFICKIFCVIFVSQIF